MAVTIDVRGEGIHPPDKLEVGRRLALLALHRTYDREQAPDSGPLYRGHRIEGPIVRVQFDHAESGLMVGNREAFSSVEEMQDTPLEWFELAGEDGVWHKAEAEISGAEVLVSAAQVSRPTAVRYACATAPQGANLYNRSGLPASPFCSDLSLLPWTDGVREP